MGTNLGVRGWRASGGDTVWNVAFFSSGQLPAGILAGAKKEAIADWCGDRL
jgi:hypothetical protein